MASSSSTMAIFSPLMLAGPEEGRG
jgi:hypothetical protein